MSVEFKPGDLVRCVNAGRAAGVVLYSPADIAADKARSRAEDVRALQAGEKSREDLRRENGRFAFPNARMVLSDVKRLY